MDMEVPEQGFAGGRKIGAGLALLGALERSLQGLPGGVCPGLEQRAVKKSGGQGCADRHRDAVMKGLPECMLVHVFAPRLTEPAVCPLTRER